MNPMKITFKTLLYAYQQYYCFCIMHLYHFYRFSVDKDTGWVSVAGALDRETVDSYVMTAEARDGGGYTTFTNLRINILDENDEAPVFRRDEYFATVKEDSLHFLREPVTVEVTPFKNESLPSKLS